MINFFFHSAQPLQGFINASLLLITWLDSWGLQAFWKLSRHNTIRFSKSVVVANAELGQEHTNTKWLL